MNTATLASITVTRSALLDGLTRVALVVPRGKALPILQSVRMEGVGDGLRLTGTDFDRTVTTVVPGDGEFPVRVIPCHRLAAIVSQLPLGPVEVEPTTNGVRIRAQRARFDVVGISPDEFPHPTAPVGNDAPVTIDGASFVSALTRLAPHCSDADSRPTLCGVHVKAAENGPLLLEATDSFRLAHERIPRTSGPALDIIIPATAIPALVKLFDSAERVTLDLRGTRAYVAGDGDALTFETRLIEGPFPATSFISDKVMPHTATVERVSLLAAVRRVAAVSTDEGLGIALTWNADHVALNGTGVDDAGTSEDSLPCSFTGTDPIRILFSPRFLISSLALRTTEMITIGLQNSTAIMTLRDDGVTAFQNCVMPRRSLGK